MLEFESTKNSSSTPFVLLGAGGHARVLLALARSIGVNILGVCDPKLTTADISRWEGLDVLGDDAAIEAMGSANLNLILGVGQLINEKSRQRLYVLWRERGYTFPALVHPMAWVAPGTSLSDGVQILAGAIIQPGCSIGENSIINTNSSIDHDCLIGANVHVAPGVTVCGSVKIGEGAYIGAGAIIVQNINIPKNIAIRAGTLVAKDPTLP